MRAHTTTPASRPPTRRVHRRRRIALLVSASLLGAVLIWILLALQAPAITNPQPHSGDTEMSTGQYRLATKLRGTVRA